MMVILKRKQGFTLIELMITAAILAIIASIAYPSYMSSVEKSRRADAKDALMQAVSLQERWYLQRNQYTDTMADIGGDTSSDGYYQITAAFDLNGTACPDSTCFTLTATAMAGGAQMNDTSCREFTIDNLGRRRSYDAGATETQSCW